MPKNRTLRTRDRDWEALEALLPAVQENHPMGMAIRNRATLASLAFEIGVQALLEKYDSSEERAEG